MAQLTLIIGNKNYSTWSLRPWLALKHAGLPFDERLVRLDDENYQQIVADVSPSRRVPVLVHGETTVWESMAILEYIHELAPGAGLWPPDRETRAMARSVSNEMHAGFSAIRNSMPMNLRRQDLKGKGRGPGVDGDVARICEIWGDCRYRFGSGGDFLFGAFGAADAMFAPVVTRFDTYGVEVDGTCESYCRAVLTHPAFVEWREAALKEPWIVREDEIPATGSSSLARSPDHAEGAG